ncbi:MAG: Rne/Rng family ribonuclease [Bdellovibrionaceae bacterium]|nr:Rne/Rng family ribonuclease [Pseudobdellovibrionaceae bacterium]
MNRLVINRKASTEQVAFVQGNTLKQFWFHYLKEPLFVGSIYKGTVNRVVKSIRSAFVDFGMDKPGFLYEKDVQEIRENQDLNNPLNIESVLSPGDNLMLQVRKAAIGNKAMRLSTHITLAGAYLVFIPRAVTKAVKFSRKFVNEEKKTQLTQWFEDLNEEASVIFRTAAEFVSLEELERDLLHLKNTWENLQNNFSSVAKGSCLVQAQHMETYLRDLLVHPIDEIIVNNEDSFNSLNQILKNSFPFLQSTLKLQLTDNLFSSVGISKSVQQLFNKKVWLKSGAYLVIEETEMGISIDVNTGTNTTSKHSPEEFVFQINKEAATEAVSQIILRACGGLIFIDFIDMEQEEHKLQLLEHLQNAFKVDQSYTRCYPVSDLGIIEISRKRKGPSLLSRASEKCTSCSGKGFMLKEDFLY